MFIFHAIIPALYPFWWKFYWLSKVPLYSVCLNLNHEKTNSNQNAKVEKKAVLVKAFDYYHHKFQLFQLFNKIVKEFEEEI